MLLRFVPQALAGFSLVLCTISLLYLMLFVQVSFVEVRLLSP